MTHLIIRDSSGQTYEFTGRSNPPHSTAAVQLNKDAVSTYQLIAGMGVEIHKWRQLLNQLGQGPITTHSSNPNEIYNAVTVLIMRGDIRIFKLPKISTHNALRGKNNVGLQLVKGPKPLASSNYRPEKWPSAQAAADFLKQLNIDNDAFLNHLTTNGLDDLVHQEKIEDALSKLLAEGSVIAYKIDLPPMTPPKPKEQLIPATGAAYQPVPLAPETKASSNNVEAKPTKEIDLVERDRQKISQLSKEADEATKAGNSALATQKIEEAREILLPYVVNEDLTAILDRLDVSSPENGAYFWSGWPDGALTKAEEFAKENNGVSLESTNGGRIVNDWKELNNSPISGDFWTNLSEKYASGASGNVEVIQSDAAYTSGGGKIWKSTELPTLVKHGKVNRVTLRDLNGNERETWNKNTMKLKSLG